MNINLNYDKIFKNLISQPEQWEFDRFAELLVHKDEKLMISILPDGLCVVRSNGVRHVPNGRNQTRLRAIVENRLQDLSDGGVAEL